MPIPTRRRWLRRTIVAIGVCALYPAFVLATVYAATAQSDLPGGRHGPRDAYRHSLASATVAYTGSPHWVQWVTAVMEDGGRGDDARAMDAHNNLLGARIGADAHSWAGMRAAVLAAVKTGDIDVKDPNRITWLPQTRWRERAY
ncbi:MAG: hypothetical protein HOP03_15795 [Lysobacter sp.]|nr:hypothetical protein [Lysobacter sp.]